MGIRQGVEQDAIDNGEKRRVRPNPKRQSENGNSGEAGRLQEYPNGVQQILRQDRHGCIFVSSLMWIIIGNQRGNRRRPSTGFEADVLRRLHAEGGGSVRPLTGGKS
jgi:hypothetical protein